MTIKELIKYGTDKLRSSNCDEAILKVRILIAHILNVSKEYLVVNEDKIVDNSNAEKIYEGINKLVNRIPIEYIVHNREFMKMNFYVDENVLIPRPDTEILVEEVLKICKKNDSVLDLCTGSGAIAISLAKYGNNLNITGIDISENALEIAKKNAETNNVKINLYKSNMFENIKNKEWDLIVSNPPYIETSVIEKLEPEVKHEPFIALNGGADGLDFYKIIINKAQEYLKPEGILAMEIGFNQAKKVEKLINESGNYYNIKIIKDLGENDRVIICKRRE